MFRSHMFIQSKNACFVVGTWLDTGDKMTSKTGKGPVLRELILLEETDGNRITPQTMEPPCFYYNMSFMQFKNTSKQTSLFLFVREF